MTDKKRYSDEDLQEFKELILSKLAKAQADYDLLKAQIVNINDTNDTSPTFKALEEGASTLSKEEARVDRKTAEIHEQPQGCPCAYRK